MHISLLCLTWFGLEYALGYIKPRTGHTHINLLICYSEKGHNIVGLLYGGMAWESVIFIVVLLCSSALSSGNQVLLAKKKPNAATTTFL